MDETNPDQNAQPQGKTQTEPMVIPNEQGGDAASPPKISAKDTWVTLDDIRAAIAHTGLDVWKATIEEVRTNLIATCGKKGGTPTIQKGLLALQKETAPAISATPVSISLPKELISSLSSQWDMAVTLARTTYLHQLEAKRAELEFAQRLLEKSEEQANAQGSAFDTLSDQFDVAKAQAVLDLSAAQTAVADAQKQVTEIAGQLEDLKKAHAITLEDAAEQLRLATGKNEALQNDFDLKLENAAQRAALRIQTLEGVISGSAHREADLHERIKQEQKLAMEARQQSNELAQKFAAMMQPSTPAPSKSD